MKSVKNPIMESTTGEPNSAKIGDLQIKGTMKDAQRMIAGRNRALDGLKNDETPPVVSTPLPTRSAPGVHQTDDKAKRIAELQAEIQSKLSSSFFAIKQDKPTPLILNNEGRTVDSSGKEIQLSQITPTLKANIHAKRSEEFCQPGRETSETKLYDPRISIRPSTRAKRTFKFHEPGKFLQIGERKRMKAQLEKYQNEVSQIGRKIGISSMTKLAQIALEVENEVEEIPKVEWWDTVILEGEEYSNKVNGFVNITQNAITHLVEHPTQMKSPTSSLKAGYMPVFLTKKEKKKLRRQNRKEAWKEKQEKIRLGLESPPEPKLRISNLMRVRGTEAVQDPTITEAHVRAQMAERQKSHEESNAARQLSTEQRKEKKFQKIQEDTTFGVNVAIYRVDQLSSASKKFKVENNAKQLFMTGCVVMFEDCNVIVVEGGPKQQKKFKELMLNRINWEEDTRKDEDGKDIRNKCILEWEGLVKQRNFGEMKFKVCDTEKLAREQFRKHQVEQYWDLVYSKAVMDDE